MRSAVPGVESVVGSTPSFSSWRFAFAETLAHLEYLREEGAVGRGGPPYRYFRR